jgi:hypothetical protein
MHSLNASEQPRSQSQCFLQLQPVQQEQEVQAQAAQHASSSSLPWLLRRSLSHRAAQQRLVPM